MSKLEHEANRRHLITGFLPGSAHVQRDPVAAICGRIRVIVETLGHLLMPDNVAVAFGLASDDALDLPYKLIVPLNVPGGPLVLLPLVEKVHGQRRGHLHDIGESVLPERQQLWSTENADDLVATVQHLDDALKLVRDLAKEIELFRIQCMDTNESGSDGTTVVKNSNLRKVMLTVKAALLQLTPIGGGQNPTRAIFDEMTVLYNEELTAELDPVDVSKLRRNGSMKLAGFAVLSLARLIDDERTIRAHPDEHAGSDYVLNESTQLMQTLLQHRTWFYLYQPYGTDGTKAGVVLCTLVPLSLRNGDGTVWYSSTAIDVVEVETESLEGATEKRKVTAQNKWREQQSVILGHGDVQVYQLQTTGRSGVSMDTFKTHLKDKSVKVQYLRPNPTSIVGAVSTWATRVARSNRHQRIRDNSTLSLEVELSDADAPDATADTEEMQKQLAGYLTRTREKLVASDEATREDLHMQVTLAKLIPLVTLTTLT